MSVTEFLPRTFWDAPTSTIFSPALLLTSVVLLLAHWLRPLWRRHWRSRHLPGPRGLPLLGVALEVQGTPAELTRILNRWHAQYGKLIRVQLLHHIGFFISDPTDVKYALGKIKVHNRPWYMGEPVVMNSGHGLITLPDNQVYKTHRRMLNPLFYPAMLKNYKVVFEDRVQILSEKLSEVADGRNIDILPYTSSLTMETICSTVIGIDVSDERSRSKEFVEAVRLEDDLFMDWVVQPWLRIPVVRNLFRGWSEMFRVKQICHTFIEQLVLKKKKELEQGFVRPAAEEDDAKSPPSMLDMIVRESQSEATAFTTEAVRAELHSIIAAGFLTSASSLAFLMVLLGIHQDFQDAVSRELEEVFGSSLRPATEEDLTRLETLERVIKETLRLFPTVPFLGRHLYEDVHLPSGNVLPGNSLLFVNTYQLHRDQDSYHEPDKFLPDRWLPENSGEMNPDAFIPFGIGSRYCIGSRYAMLQLKVASSHLLRKFRVTTDYTMKDLTNNISGIMTIKPEIGCNVQLHKRALGDART